MRKIREALSNEDKYLLIDLEVQILELKRRLIDVGSEEEKEAIGFQIQGIKDQMKNIKRG